MKREKNRGLQRALQVRFVLLATLSAALLVGSIVGIVLLRSYGQIVKKADHLLELIQTSPNSPEIGDAHYFSVLVSYGTRTVSADLSHTSFVREWTAVSMGRQVLKNGKVRGFLEGYRFCVMKSAEGAEILFLSRRLPLETFRNTEKLLIWVSILGILGTAAILALLSGRIVAPLVEAKERQKRFVTSASHGLKTPVAVILGDTQLLQMEMPENEWLNDIEKQAKRLTEMTQSLVTLARWDEGGQPGSRIAFPISDVAEDIAASFRAIAENRGLPFQVRIARNLSYCGDEKALREMMTVLLDNAFRYCPEDGCVGFALEKRYKGVALTVRNTADNVKKEELPHFTERFYRGSTAENTQGSGLGLAIVQSIVRQHHGKLTVDAPSERESESRVIL